MTERLRAGIIGAGFIGAVHARAVRAAGGVVTRVAASTPERSAEAADRLGALAPAGTGADVIDSPDVDVVHICTPNSSHVALAEHVLAAAKPVICEKPLATTLSDARSLAAEAAGKAVATVPFVYRFYPAVREARARIAAGEAGPLHLLHGAYLQDWQSGGAAGWRGQTAEGGEYRAFADIGVHWCDVVEFISGHRITRLLAHTVDGGASTTMLFTTDAGAAGSVVVSQTAIGRRNALRFSVDGAIAAYGFDQEQPETLMVGGLEGNLAVHRGSRATSAAAARYSLLPPGHPHGYQDCFNAFVTDTYSAIAGSAPDGLPTFTDGVRAAAIVDAVIASSTTSTWVDVPT